MKGWAALFGALGAVALGFGMLSAVLALFQPATDLAWVVGNLAVGLLFLGGAIVASLDSLRERMHSGEARRAGRYGSSAITGTALSIAILCALAFLSTRYSTRFDWSEAGVNTLSEQTQDVLSRLDRDVEITAFFNAADAPPIRDRLQRYAHESDRVKLTFADPNRRPDLVEAYGLDPESLARGLVRIAIDDQSLELDQFGESEITNALLKLRRDENRKVLLLEGHNERSFEAEPGDAGPGFSTAVAALRNETYAVESILLASVGEVPDDADVVVLAGPTRPLLEAERAALRRYLQRGGALMVLLDPRANTNIADDLAELGVVLQDDVVFDAKLAIFGQATSPFSGRYEDHPITEKMRDTVIFHMARSVRVADAGAGGLEEIVFTGEDSWAETNLEGWQSDGSAEFDAADLLGPVPLMVAGTLQPGGAEAAETEDGAEPPQARLVVIGDADFASNALIGNYQNRDLFVNAVNWLVDDADQITVRPPISRASRFKMTGLQFMRIQLLSLFVLPEAIAVAGVFAWWWRRKRPGS